MSTTADDLDDNVVVNLTPEGYALLEELDKIAQQFAVPIEALLVEQEQLDAARGAAIRVLAGLDGVSR